MKVQSALAAAELALNAPAALFMSALFLRNVQPLDQDPAHFVARAAEAVVQWYSGRTHLGLWVFLMLLPLLGLLLGLAALARAWRGDDSLRAEVRRTAQALRAHGATLVIALATLAAGSMLAVVALHVLTD